MAEDRITIGLDLGTSGLKAVALDRSGRTVERVTFGYATVRGDDGGAEQSPADWWTAIDSALGTLGTRCDPRSWVAIGLSAMLPTLVVTNEAGQVEGPAITWEDSRAEECGRRFRLTVGEEELYRRTGQIVDGRYLVTMDARLAVLNPHRPCPRRVLGAKDYVFWRLTGEWLTDPSTAAGYGLYNLRRGEWDAQLAREAGEDALLPSVRASATAVEIRPELAGRFGCRTGLPVVLGAADSVLGAYGLGVRRPGQVAYIAGTSTAIVGFGDEPVFDTGRRFLLTPMADGGFGAEMDVLSTGSGLAWLAGILGVSGAAGLVADAVGADVVSAPLVLPYLAPGEQGALWDDRLAGAVDGLTLATTRTSLARGLLTGIVLESRRCLSVLDETFHRTGPGEVFVSGASGSTRQFRQDLADASGCPVTFAEGASDHSAVGAALLAGRAADGWDPVVPTDTVTLEPDTARRSMWDDLASRHDELRRRLYPPTGRLMDVAAHAHGDV